MQFIKQLFDINKHSLFVLSVLSLKVYYNILSISHYNKTTDRNKRKTILKRIIRLQ